jgi:hypothetical protein
VKPFDFKLSSSPGGRPVRGFRRKPGDRLVDYVKAGRYIGRSRWTIDNLVKGGWLTPIQLPGVRGKLIDLNDLDALIDKLKEGRSGSFLTRSS